MRKLAIVVVPSFVFLTVFAELFITTLFTKSYAQTHVVFHLHAAGAAAHLFILSSIPQIYGKTRLNLYVVCLLSRPRTS